MRPRDMASRRRFIQMAGMGTAVLAPFSIELEARLDGSQFISKSNSEPSSWVRIDSNENPYGPSEKALTAIRDSLASSCRYDRTSDELHSVLCSLHQVPSSMVESGFGSSEIIKMAVEAFLRSGKSLIVAHPTYEAPSRCAEAYGSDVVRIPLNAAFQHDLQKMSAAVNEKTGLVYICNPNNPTATVASAAQIKEFLLSIPRRVPVLIDEAYHHYVEDPNYATAIPLVKDGLPVIVTRTFSKIYGMAGLRVGYTVGREDLIGRMVLYKLWLNHNVLSSAAALASLSDEQHVRKMQRTNSEIRTHVAQEVKSMGLTPVPSQANFMMIDVKRDVRTVLEALRSRQISAGRPFSPLNTHLRVTIGTKDEMERFLQALREVVT
jgi:histidinol-phosphate aminotransferase